MKHGRILILLLCLSAPLFAAEQVAEPSGDRLLVTVGSTVQTRIRTQEVRDDWEAEQKRLQQRLRELETQKTRLERQTIKKRQAVTEVRAAVTESERMITEAAHIDAQLEDFLWGQLSWLEQHQEQSLPYLREERNTRIRELNQLMASPRAAGHDRYRRIMEAMLVECEYGSTCETYREEIHVAGEPVTAEILRVGTLALFARTPDGDELAVLDPAGRTWRTLPENTHVAVNEAFAIAAREQTADLTRLPLGRIELP